MDQTFRANKVAISIDKENGVVITGFGDLDQREMPRYYFTVVRSIPGHENQDDEDRTGADIEFNGQENGGSARDVKKLTLSKKQCLIEFAKNSNIRSGRVGRTGTQKLDNLIIDIDLSNEKLAEIEQELKKCFPREVVKIFAK